MHMTSGTTSAGIEGAEGPHLVSVILDGENAWEYYDNDGKAFLHGLYERLSADDPLIETVTPSEFLEIAPEQPGHRGACGPGRGSTTTSRTWIGEEEENKAWDYLGTRPAPCC
jgi:alpha-amylase/alpha-mannosidase (GH57 family)